MFEFKRESWAGHKEQDQVELEPSACGRHVEFPGAHSRPLTSGAATACGLRAKQDGRDPFREIDRIVAKSW